MEGGCLSVWWGMEDDHTVQWLVVKKPGGDRNPRQAFYLIKRFAEFGPVNIGIVGHVLVL